jgi:hypothetical protein
MNNSYLYFIRFEYVFYVECCDVCVYTKSKTSELTPLEQKTDHMTEARMITFNLNSDHILDHCSKIDLRSYQDHIAVQ